MVVEVEWTNYCDQPVNWLAPTKPGNYFFILFHLICLAIVVIAFSISNNSFAGASGLFIFTL